MSRRRITETDLRRDYARPERIPIDLEGIHKKRLGSIRGYTIWAVDGTVLRDEVDTDFIGGGNHARYGYIPEKEIWIEQALPWDDQAPFILHEIVECVAMLKGASYSKAHGQATEVERKLRSQNVLRKVLYKEPLELVNRFLP